MFFEDLDKHIATFETKISTITQCTLFSTIIMEFIKRMCKFNKDL